jgi:NAD(P)-dependent dehydrogenase (short-subunit alcohol dehydrogenase family)
VSTASVSGTSALPDLHAYNSSKHAVVIMTRVDARQFAPDRIHVNSVCPGYVPAPMMTSAGFSEERFNLIKILSPMKRITYLEEVAEMVVFLSSSRASAITGVDLAVDAGATLYHMVLSPLNKCNSGSPQNQPGTVQLPYKKNPAIGPTVTFI